jgi:inner membrane protein
MLLFAHTGITLGAAAVIAGIANQREKTSWFNSLARFLDIRWLVVGSMLPDIIDKPVGMYFFRDTFSNGRIFSHTLLFLLILTAVGVLLYKTRRQVWMMALVAGTLMHFIMDSMWRTPGTLLWPLMGTGFNTIEVEGWVEGIFKAYVSVPRVYIPELIGLAVLIWFGIIVIKRKKITAFLKAGRIS